MGPVDLLLGAIPATGLRHPSSGPCHHPQLTEGTRNERIVRSNGGEVTLDGGRDEKAPTHVPAEGRLRALPTELGGAP